jgi:hypothetical protein
MAWIWAHMQSIFRHSYHAFWGTYHSGRSKSESLGGKMMCPADVEITWPPLGHHHQFGSVDLEGASFIWSIAVALQCPATHCLHHSEPLEHLAVGDSSPSSLESWFGTTGLSPVPQIEEAPSRSMLPNWWISPTLGQVMATSAGRTTLPTRLWLFDLPLW